MSENKDQKPTERKLREARKRGEVAFSADVASTTVIVVVLVAIWLLGGYMFEMLQSLWLEATSATLLARPDDRFSELLLHAARALLWLTLPIAVLAALAAIAGSFFQVGGLLAWQRLKPDLNHMNPAQGIKRVFSTRNLIGLLKMLVKTLLLGALVWLMLRTLLDTAVDLGYLQPASIMAVVSHSVLKMFAWATLIYVLMAGLDYAHVRYEFMKDQRMSIDEVRRDYKEAQGDPLTRARRRSTHFESVYIDLADRVAAASAVIHSDRIAVALQYLGERDLPRVIARGENEIAMQMRAHATEALVPLVAEADLAERLYAEVPLDRPIPRALYEPVAKLLRWAHGAD